MFNYIRGTLADKSSDAVVIDNSGIGWQISVPSTVISQINDSEDVKLFTYLAVREDAMQLYGFLKKEDLTLFKLLLSVSGIGPKAALAVLSTLSSAEFFLAVMHENVKTLTRVPGVGQKSAKRLIVELKEKVTALNNITPDSRIIRQAEPAAADSYNDALAALLALGYNGSEAQTALQKIEDGHMLSVEELIRKALVLLGSQ